MTLRLEPNLRVFITGKTQSGKTYLTKQIIRGSQNVLVYDLKREYGDFGAVVHSIPEMMRAFTGGCTRVIYQPEDLSPEHFNDVCGFIFQCLKRVLFVVDEVHKFCPKHKIPANFNTLVTVCQGEPYKIGVVAITQRPANVHNDVISSSSVIIAFRLNLKTDAEAVTGIPAERIMQLQKHHFLVFDDRETESPVREFKPV